MRLLKKITFVLAVMATTAQAQDISDFNVFPHPGTSIGRSVCLGQAIRVEDNSTGGNGAVTYNFGDGTPTTNPSVINPTHTYATANSFTVTQTLPTAGSFVTSTQVVKVVPNVSLSATYTVCGSGRVNLHIMDLRFDSYDVDFGDGTAVVNVARDPSGDTESAHIYTVISAHTVSIKGKFAAGNYCSASDFSLSVTPIAAVPKPDVVFLKVDTEDQTNGKLIVRVKNSTNFTYSWDFKRNGFSYTSNLGTIPSTSGQTDLELNKTNTNPYAVGTGLYNSYTVNTKQNSYCVRLATTTACGREVLSDEICSITKFVGTAADLQNDLTWEAYAGPNSSSIDVLRDGGVLVNLPGNAAAHNDNTVTCAIQYTYQIKETLTTTSSEGPMTSWSAEKKILATSLTPRPALTNVNSTVNGSSVNVTFDAPAGFTAKSYNLLESVNGGGYNSVAANSGSPTNFTVSGRNTVANTYCYQVNYTDLCNLSPANGSAVTTCPIKLNVGLAEDGSVVANWTAYSGSTPANSYTVEVRNENGTVIRTIPAGSSLTTTDLLSSGAGQLFYIVIADNGSQSSLVELQLSPTVFVPDAFSPNGDGTNDYFELKGRFIKDINLSVYNRWGEPVFHSTDVKKLWDGKVNGGDSTVGTYAYTLEVTGFKGEVIKQKGTITLVR